MVLQRLGHAGDGSRGELRSASARRRRPVPRQLLAFMVAFACPALHAPPTFGQPARTARIAPAYSQVEVKAAFLYRFGSYVRWPSLDRRDAPITIAVLNAPDIATELERFVANRTIDGHAVRVRRLRSIYAIRDDDHMLFIGRDENSRLAQIINMIGERPLLTVTDAPDGLADGAMINFQLVERRVRFEISLTRARAAGLRLSSRLLAAAIKVETSQCAELCRQGGKPEQVAVDSRIAVDAYPRHF